MNFEKIKYWLKKFRDIQVLYIKEKKNLLAFIYCIYAMPILLIFRSILQIKLFSFYHFLMLTTCTFIMCVLASITFLQLENYRQKYKNTFLDRFLNKVEKFELFFKKENIIKGVILHIFRIFIILFITVVLFKIGLSTKSLIILTFGAISLLILLNSIESFILDLISLVKEKKE